MSNYSCQSCGKAYKTRSGLWKHNKKCNGINEDSNREVANKKTKLKKLQLDIKQLELKNSIIKYNQDVLIEKYLSKCKAINITDFNKDYIEKCCLDYCKQLTDITEIINKPLRIVVKKILTDALNKCDDVYPFYCVSIKNDEFVVYYNNYWNYKNINEKLLYVYYKIRNTLMKLFKEYEEYDDIAIRNFSLWDRIVCYIMNTRTGDYTDIEKTNKELIDEVIKPLIINHCLVSNRI